MTSSTGGSLSTSDSTMQKLRGHQTDAATNIGASNSFQTPKSPNAELGTNVKNSHGPVSTASFAAVRTALTNRGEASAKLQRESERLARNLTTAAKMYNETDSTARNDLDDQIR